MGIASSQQNNCTAGKPMIEKKIFANGFEYLHVSNQSAEAEIALQGAHLFHYRRHGDSPLLWLSSLSHFEHGKAIRGGIPICWPWFGKHSSNPNLPQHGFARTAIWEHVETKEKDDSTTEITLQLKETPESLSLWPHSFCLRLQIIVSETLQLRLITTNCDSDNFVITSALHSYFGVSDIRNVRVSGLDQTPFLDTLTMQREVQDGDIRINQEIDRVYQGVANSLELSEDNRRILIQNEGSQSSVVWNPWIEKSRGMSDFNNDGYQNMLCIETANAMEDERLLAPGATHTLGVIIS